MKPLRLALVSGCLLVSGGCFMQKKPAVQIPVAVPPAASPAAPVPAVAPQPTPAAAEAPAVQQPAAPKPAAPAAAAPVRTPAPGTPRLAPTPAPALGVILSADQRKQLDAAYQSDLRQANAVLASLGGRALSPAQADTVSRARAFIRQAAQFHDRDLTTAAELAHRARVLTHDLAGAPK